MAYEFLSGLVTSLSLKVGDKMKDFSMKGVNGITYSLKDFMTRKVLVVVFISNNSRYSHAYNTRLVAIQKSMKHRSVQVIAVNSNDPALSVYDNFYQMKIQAGKRGFNFPYLKDPYQKLARNFDAVCNPEAFVFDKDRVLRYRGKIDDNWSNPSAVKVNYVVRAIKEILAGKDVSISETIPLGDSINWHY